MAVITTCWTDSSSVIICWICSVFRRQHSSEGAAKYRLTHILSHKPNKPCTYWYIQRLHAHQGRVLIKREVQSFFQIENCEMVCSVGHMVDLSPSIRLRYKARNMWFEWILTDVIVIFTDGCIDFVFIFYLVSSHNWQHSPKRAAPASQVQWHLPSLL